MSTHMFLNWKKLGPSLLFILINFLVHNPKFSKKILISKNILKNRPLIFKNISSAFSHGPDTPTTTALRKHHQLRALSHHCDTSRSNMWVCTRFHWERMTRLLPVPAGLHPSCPPLRFTHLRQTYFEILREYPIS